MQTIEFEYLLDIILRLSRSRNIQDIVDICRQAGRKLTGADGATFILKDKDFCYYVDEDAVGPLWKGSRFPIEACISGWAMINKSHTVVRDIYLDPRIPIDCYESTFVRSLVIVPINIDNPIGAIGNYWGVEHNASDEEVKTLTFLAEVASIALQHVEILNQLEGSLSIKNEQKRIHDERMQIVSQELAAATNSKMLILNEIERLTNLIKEQFGDTRHSEMHLKKVIYEISLKQLNEMDNLLREYVAS